MNARGLMALALPAVCAAGLAWSDEARPLTLGEALEMAQRQNPELLAARAHAEAQSLRADAARRRSWPRLAAASAATRSDNPATVFAQKLNAAEFTQDDFLLARLNAPQALTHVTTSLTLEAPLDAFGVLGAASRAQVSVAQSDGAAAQQAQQDVRRHVIEAYHQAALAERAVQVTALALQGAQAREADVEARVGEGAALQADGLRARARRRQREADLAAARGEARLAGAQLSRLLGVSAPTAWTLVDGQVPNPPAGAEVDVEAWVAQALARRASLERARHASDAARWALRAEQRSRLPEFSLWGQLQDDRNGLGGGHRTATVGAQVRWSAFDATRAKRAAAAAADARAAQSQAQAAADQVRLEVQAACLRLQSARERWQAAAGGAEEGREALRVLQERRRNGLATLTDELETEAAALMAELEELRAATAAALAQAALEHAAGAL